MENKKSTSRFERAKQENSEGLIKKVVVAFMVLGIIFWVYQDIEPIQNQLIEGQEILTEEVYLEEVVNESVDVKVEAVEALIEEEQPMDFYYKRALKRDKNDEFKGAVEDYSKTISLAKKYSSEMWYSLNNGGIIKAQEFRDYKGALKDFNRIIEIEINRYDGEINLTRLEAGYSNRAYIRKMKGDIDGACDDLYEALSLGVEGSEVFIEKQIEKNCL